MNGIDNLIKSNKIPKNFELLQMNLRVYIFKKNYNIFN